MKLPQIQGDGKNFSNAVSKALTELKTELANQVAPIAFSGAIKNIQIEEVWRDTGSNIYVSDLNISFDAGNVVDYSYTELWTKSQIDGTWKFIDYVNSKYIDKNVTVGSTYTYKFVAVNRTNQKDVFETAPTFSYKVVGKNYYPLPPTNFIYEYNSNGILWKWDKSISGDVAFYELREDQNYGSEVGCLDKTINLTSTANPSTRSGTIYLYAVNNYGRYSSACSLQISIPVPTIPKNIVIKEVALGISISFDQIPDNCIGAVVSINNELYETPNNYFVYHGFYGTFNIKVAYQDQNGIGVWSNVNTITVNSQINGTLIEDGTIVTSHVLANTLEGDRIKTNTLDASKIVSKSITADQIKTGSITSNEIKAGSITGDSIAGNSIHGSKIIGESITGDQIKAGSIKATAIEGDFLNLNTTGNVLSAGAVKLDATGMKVLQPSGAYTMFNDNGISWVDVNGISYGAVTRTVSGIAKNGQYVRLNFRKIPKVLLSPKSIQTTIAGYSNADLKVVCEAYNITPSGFNVLLETRVLSGSGGMSASGVPWVDKTITMTTPINITAISCTTHATMGVYKRDNTDGDPYWHSNIVSYYLEYKLTTSATWIKGNVVRYSGKDGKVHSSTNVVATGLTPGQYNVRVRVPANPFADGAGMFYDMLPTVDSFSYNGGGTVTFDSEVSFIAIESDDNSYYTIE